MKIQERIAREVLHTCEAYERDDMVFKEFFAAAADRILALVREGQEPIAYRYRERIYERDWGAWRLTHVRPTEGNGVNQWREIVPLFARPVPGESEGERARHPGLFHCPFDEARRLMPELPWDEAPRWPDVEYVVDVKVHKLMPGQWPCIPGWHQDFVPRDPETLAEHHALIDVANPPMMMWLSGPPFTEFKDGRTIPPETWVEFTQADEHRGTPATEHGWRTFIRIAPAHVVRAGLPGEAIPAPPDQWLRRHSQVYLNAEDFAW